MALSLITKGILHKLITIETARIYYPLTVNIKSKKPKINIDRTEIILLNLERKDKFLSIDISEQIPTINITPIKKKIYINIKNEE